MEQHDYTYAIEGITGDLEIIWRTQSDTGMVDT
jgi:hypothetical protein